MSQTAPFSSWRACLALMAGLIQAGCAVTTVDTGGPLVVARQGSFFVAGREFHSTTLRGQPAARPPVPTAGASAVVDPSIGTIVVEQMYVQFQVPVSARALSVAFIHGCCLTGASWESTPDGRMGWAEYFVRRGYSAYVVDQVARGRSALNATPIAAVRTGNATPDGLPAGYHVGRELAWSVFRCGDEYPIRYPGLQYRPAAEAEIWKQMVPDFAFSFPPRNPTVPALNQLVGRIGGNVVLLGHSQSGMYPFLAYRQNPAGIAAIIAVEPTACPTGAEEVGRYLTVPVLLLWGDYIASSAFWAPRLSQCKTFVEEVNRAGGRASLITTTDRGMSGNSHMLMQDSNNLAVADIVLQWLDRLGR